MFGFIRVNSFFDKEIKSCIALGETYSLLDNIKFKSAKSYAISNGVSTKDHWGNYEEPSDSFLRFNKTINGETYTISFKVTLNGGTELTVHTREQATAHARSFL
jgi:hypothetical protein